MKKMQLTILMEKGDDGWIGGQLKEYPAVISQGRTVKELKENLKDALKLYLDCQAEEMQIQKNTNKITESTLVFQL